MKAKLPNGLRYPLVGGTRQRRFDGTNSKSRKLLKNAPTPTTPVPVQFAGVRVHAVLGGFIASLDYVFYSLVPSRSLRALGSRISPRIAQLFCFASAANLGSGYTATG